MLGGGEKMSRSENSFKNIGASLLMTVINIALGFITQKIFAHQLGTINLGLNGLFTNIISVLSIADLGIGTAIVFNMYRPISQNNIEKIKTLMSLYKKSYRIIAGAVLILGILILPFLKVIIGSNNIDIIDSSINIYLLFSLYLFDTVFSYLLTYKRSMLYANQKNYIINLIHTVCILFMYSLQIIILLIFKNFYLYLIVRIVCRLVENIIINIRTDKIYPFLRDKDIKKIDENTKIDISRRVKASIFHNIGGYIVLGTDNIIISLFIGIEMVGLYSNYLLIINALNNLIGQIFSSITASVGNLLIEKDYKKINNLCDNFNYINYWIYVIAGCMLCCCVQPFIMIWLGRDYLLSTIVVVILAINFFAQGMRKTMQVFTEAGGICYENRFVPVVEALVNIVFSVLLAKLIGLPGVFIGTILSSLVLHFYSYPKYVYRNLLQRNFTDYIKQFAIKTAIFLMILFSCIFIIKFISFNNIFINLIVNALVSFSISLGALYFLYRKSDSYRYFIYLLGELKKKIFKKTKL